MSYEIAGPTLEWALSQRGIDGTPRNYTGISQLVRNGTDEIEIPSFALSDSGTGLSILTRDATLQRFGNVFRGIVSVFDGEPLTSWDDYQQFRVELTDSNDTDSDGLPDIVSLPEPEADFQAVVALALLFGIRRLRTRSSVGIASERRRTRCS